MGRGSVLQLHDLRLGYRRTSVVEGANLKIEPGITGVVGPNGAGKSTLLGALATIRRPQQGTITWFDEPGADLDSVRRRVGFLPQRFSLVGSMTVKEVVSYAAWAHGVQVHELREALTRALEIASINDLAKVACRNLSGGQRQRVGIACAVAHNPELVILDEPTAGLDPLVRMDVRSALRELSQHSTIVLSTHLTDDIESVCDRVIVLHRGVVRFDGTPGELRDHAPVGGSGTSQGSRIERGYEYILAQAS